MDRRTFLSTLAGGLLTVPPAAEAEQAGKVFVISWLRNVLPPPTMGPIIAAFGLRQYGYVDGTNLKVEYPITAEFWKLTFGFLRTETRGALVVECKNFGLAAQSVLDFREQVSVLAAELGPHFEIETADQLDKDRSCFL